MTPTKLDSADLDILSKAGITIRNPNEFTCAIDPGCRDIIRSQVHKIGTGEHVPPVILKLARNLAWYGAYIAYQTDISRVPVAMLEDGWEYPNAEWTAADQRAAQEQHWQVVIDAGVPTIQNTPGQPDRELTDADWHPRFATPEAAVRFVANQAQSKGSDLAMKAIRLVRRRNLAYAVRAGLTWHNNVTVI